MPDFVVDSARMRQLLSGQQGPVVRAVSDVVRQGANLGKVECPVKTGRLRASHQWTVTVRGGQVIGRFGSDVEYAEDVHNGTVKTVTVKRGRSTVTTTSRRRGNPWLIRASRRAGITITR